jgi:hypothetical protein
MSARIGGGPRVAHAAHVERQHEGDAGEHDQRRADDVEPVRALVARQPAQQRRGDRQRGEPHRDVDPEDHRPVQVVGNEAAERRPAAARGRIGEREIGVVAPALLRRHQVAEHDHAHRREAAAAEPVQHAPEDEHQHVGRQRADQRAREISEDRDAQRELAAVDVGDLAVERHHRGRRQQIGGDQPGQVVDVVELAPDRRQRARQDGLVERAHEGRQQDAEDDQQRLTMGEGLGLTAVGVGVHRSRGSRPRIEHRHGVGRRLRPARSRSL